MDRTFYTSQPHYDLVAVTLLADIHMFLAKFPRVAHQHTLTCVYISRRFHYIKHYTKQSYFLLFATIVIVGRTKTQGGRDAFPSYVRVRSTNPLSVNLMLSPEVSRDLQQETFRLYGKACYEGYSDYGYTATNLLCVAYWFSFQ